MSSPKPHALSATISTIATICWVRASSGSDDSASCDAEEVPPVDHRQHDEQQTGADAEDHQQEAEHRRDRAALRELGATGIRLIGDGDRLRFDGDAAHVDHRQVAVGLDAVAAAVARVVARSRSPR